MAIAFRSAGTAASTPGDMTPGLPAGYAENDIFLLVVQASAADTITAPSGYAHVTGSPNVTAAAATAIMWKRASGSETAPTITDPGDHGHAVILAYSGCITSGNPWNAVGTFNSGGGTSYTCPTVTSTVANTHYVGVVGWAPDTAGPENATGPTQANLTGLAVRYDGGTTDGNGGGVIVFDGAWASIGATGSVTGTIVTSGGKSQSGFLLAPAVETGSLLLPPNRHAVPLLIR